MSQSDLLPESERLAWKFLPYGLRRGQPISDGSVPVVEPGNQVHLDDWAEMREPYLYASDAAMPALRDSTGLIVVRVRLLGTILRRRRSRKLYATEYEVMWWGDPTQTLNAYACDLAEEALHQGQAAGYDFGPTLLGVVQMKRAWLAGNLDTTTLQQQARQAYQEAWMHVTPDTPPHSMARIWLQTALALATVARPDATFKAMASSLTYAFIMQGPYDMSTALNAFRRVDNTVERLLLECGTAWAEAGHRQNRQC